MPTYDYACGLCGHEFEEFQSITARPLKKCPECGENGLSRLIGTGAGVIFKGSGFYETDYRSESYKKAAEAEKKSATPEKAESSKSGEVAASSDSSKPAQTAKPAAAAKKETSTPKKSDSDKGGKKKAV